MKAIIIAMLILVPIGNVFAQDKSLSEITFEEFEKKALQKTRDLSDYIIIISSKSTHPTDVKEAINQACNLFVNEQATVEVSSINRELINYYEIRKYLKLLEKLQYDKVEISWSDVHYVSKLRKGTDGNYYGTISISQRFTGFIDGKIVYTDQTDKNIEVVLKRPSYDFGGEKKEYWEILLSDIGVQETSI